jgi:hypothetical protein
MIHPNSLANLQKGRRNDPIVQCPFCNKLFKKPHLHQHTPKCVQNPQFGTPCPKCGTLKHPSKQTCSTGCYNSLYRTGKNNPNYQTYKNYRTTCFIHHEKKCCVCGWDLIVEAHHFDGNHNNNDPGNLIPLCPNHHQLWHSGKRELIRDVVEKYHTAFGKRGRGGSTFHPD